MRILFVCQQYIHAARWINQLKNSGHEIYLFDCMDKPIHEDLLWTKFTTGWSKRKLPYIKGEYFLEKKLPGFFRVVAPFLKMTASEKLKELIEEIKPDLVHSLEMQSQTYPLLKVRKKTPFNWAYFSWGSDLYLYKNQKKHSALINQVFSCLDYLFVDNTRDISLAKELGFKNTVAGNFPGGGGYKIKDLKSYIQPLNERKLILIKGYHHWAGRAITVLEALEKNISIIKGYEVYVYSAHPIVIDKIEELNLKYKLKITYSSRYDQISHQELLEKFGKAKIAIGNSISDGIPNSLLEAIVLGAFPIQSNPGKVTEDFIMNGKNGFLIENPEDPNEIATLISKSLASEETLKIAFETNQKLSESLAYSIIKNKVLETYAKIETEL